MQKTKRLSATKPRLLSMESLENRRVLAGLPFGATALDTGEFMLGTVAVTPVLLESNGDLDTSTENWTAPHIEEVLDNVREGMQWWVDTLATKSALAPLSFTFDTDYADTPVSSKYEPISRRSNDYSQWTADFLTTIGFPRTGNLETDMRAFNQAQRVKHETDWSFTIFVVNSQNDADGQFLAGGSFNRAFAFAGGLFMIVPSSRPASTYAHESGHIFWARDEYAGGGSFSDQRGYYNTQNTNASNNPTPGFVQQPSIMAAGTLLDTAYTNQTSPASTLAMIGWQDSDGDGIFDVLDVPNLLTGAGYFDTLTNTYKFMGNATVQTLPNLNSSGLRNDITINRIREIEVRFDSGAWQLVSTPNQPQTTLDLSINVPSSATQIQLRARDSHTSVVSNVFTGRLSRADATQVAGINGAVWIDTNRNNLRDIGEHGQPGWLIELIDGTGNGLALRKAIEPDSLPAGVIPTSYSPDWTITAIGSDTDGRVGAFPDDNGGSTGTHVFKPYAKSGLTFTNWNSFTRRMQVNFSSPTSVVQIDAIGDFNSSYGRLEAYDSTGKLLARYTTQLLTAGQPETMTIARDTADIAYVIAGGHANRNVKLDNLQYGPRATTTTGELGTYSFPGLASGSYLVQATPAGAFLGIDPENRIHAATVVAGTSTTDIDLGFVAGSSPWQNQRDPNDVNDDGLISALDSLLIINEINAGGSRDLRGTNLPFPPYIDVTGENLLSGIDVLQVVNYINAHGGSGEGESLASPAPNQTFSNHSITAAAASSIASPAPPIDQLIRQLEDDDDAWLQLLTDY